MGMTSFGCQFPASEAIITGMNSTRLRSYMTLRAASIRVSVGDYCVTLKVMGSRRKNRFVGTGKSFDKLSFLIFLRVFIPICFLYFTVLDKARMIASACTKRRPRSWRSFYWR